VGLGLVASSALHGQAADTTYKFEPIPVILSEMVPTPEGATIGCDSVTNKPIVVVDSRTLGTQIFAERVTHGMFHVRQFWFHVGGCVGALRAWYKYPRTRLEMEGEAYCKTYHLYYKGEELEAKIDSLPGKLWMNYGLHDKMMFSEVENRVKAICDKTSLRVARSP
jgi:hypothetical protein